MSKQDYFLRHLILSKIFMPCHMAALMISSHWSYMIFVEVIRDKNKGLFLELTRDRSVQIRKHLILL